VPEKTRLRNGQDVHVLGLSSINQSADNFRYYSRSRLRKYHCS